MILEMVALADRSVSREVRRDPRSTVTCSQPETENTQTIGVPSPVLDGGEAELFVIILN